MADDPFARYLPDGSMTLGFVACVKVLDSDGSYSLQHIYSEDVTSWERVGMATSLLDVVRDRMSSAYEDETWQPDDDAEE